MKFHTEPKLLDGVRIDKEFHEIFNPTDSKFFIPRGKAREIKVLFNNKIFTAEYRFEDQTDKHIILQSIRFRKELKLLLLGGALSLAGVVGWKNRKRFV